MAFIAKLLERVVFVPNQHAFVSVLTSDSVMMYDVEQQPLLYLHVPSVAINIRNIPGDFPWLVTNNNVYIQRIPIQYVFTIMQMPCFSEARIIYFNSLTLTKEL